MAALSILADGSFPANGVDAYIQYGCFGLLAGLVIWSLLKGIPGALAIHKETMESIANAHQAAVDKIADAHQIAVDKMAIEHKATVGAIAVAFEKEASLCREERLATARVAAEEREKDRSEREKDREQREKSTAMIQELALRINTEHS
jgi:hypothetical protein